MTSLLLQATGIESAMLDNDKLMVVLAVVLIIWVGIILLIYITDRKIDRIESQLPDLPSEDGPVK